MLVLSRKSQQQIQIGDNITISILQVKGNVVRVGIEAPRDVRVVRGELPREGDVQQPEAQSSGIQPTVTAAARTPRKERPLHSPRCDSGSAASLRLRLSRRMAAIHRPPVRSDSPSTSEMEAIPLAAGSCC